MNSVRSARQRMKRYPDALSQCVSQAAIYGKCIAAKENVKQNICQKEFEALKDCIKNANQNLFLKIPKMHFLQRLTHYLFGQRGLLIKAELLSISKCPNKWFSSFYNFKPANKYGRTQLLTSYHSSVQLPHIFLSASLELYHNQIVALFLHTSSTPDTQNSGGKCDEDNDTANWADLKSRLSKIFNYKFEEVPEVIKKYTFLSHMSLSLIELKIDIMKAYNLPLSFMKQNMRIFYHVSVPQLVRRLNLLKDNGFLDDNPVLSKDKLGHYLECSNEVFHIGFQKLCTEIQSLEGCSSQVEYIQKRLRCSRERAVTLISSSPLSRSVSNTKLKEFFDFVLLEANLSPSMVEQNIRLCSFSIHRLRERMKIMELANISKDKWPAIWHMSESKFTAQFQEFI